MFENILSLPSLFIILIALLFISAFFSCSETCMMAINRYKLRHLASEQHHRKAKWVLGLLEHTDKLLAVILIGNTFANIFASAIATLIGARLYGEKGIFFTTIVLTLIVLIFAEIGPKTLAARNPQRYAFLVVAPLRVALWVLYPLVWLSNLAVKVVLFPLRATLGKVHGESLNTAELKSIVTESGHHISAKDQEMLVSILDLEQVSVEDLMVPRSEIIGIDLADEWQDIMTQLTSSQHTLLPVYENELNTIHGIVHMRDVLHLLAEQRLTKESLLTIVLEAYFIPEKTSVNRQLLNFQKHKTRIAFVVDEYGDIQGLLTLEDILEEVVGEFTTDISDTTDIDIYPQEDSSYIIDGGTSLRELNRQLKFTLPTDKAKTLSGLIIAMLDDIPTVGTCMKINGYPLEVLQVKDNRVKTIKLFPQLTQQ
jgi:Mg2+/Co2+ transporter CorB